VQVFSEGVIVSNKLDAYLAKHTELDARLSKMGERVFYSTGDAAQFEKIGAQFLGEPFNATRVTLTAPV
jgi:glutamate racemase